MYEICIGCPRTCDDVKEAGLCGHSEKLAIACALINTPKGTTIHVKNRRVCKDCHSATTVISEVEQQTMFVRDANHSRTESVLVGTIGNVVCMLKSDVGKKSFLGQHNGQYVCQVSLACKSTGSVSQVPRSRYTFMDWSYCTISGTWPEKSVELFLSNRCIRRASN